MNSSFEPKTLDQKQRGSHAESKSAIAYPSHTIVRAKLEMTEPGDYDEQEADAVANTVMSGGKIAREISGGSSSSGIAVPRRMESRLLHSQGGGQPMPQGLRSMMESSFGRDLSQVRLHTDSNAISLSSSIHARAFTLGNNIYFNRDQFSPDTASGQRLVAHELTHVIQGRGVLGRETEPEEESQTGITAKNTADKNGDVPDYKTDFLEMRVSILEIKDSFDDIIDDLKKELILEGSDVLATVSAICGIVSGIGSLIGIALPAVGAVMGGLGGIASIATSQAADSKNASNENVADEIKKGIKSIFNALIKDIKSSSEKGKVKYDATLKEAIDSLHDQIFSEPDEIKKNLKAQIMQFREVLGTPFREKGYHYSYPDSVTRPPWDMGLYLAELDGHLVTGGYDEKDYFHIFNKDFESSLPEESIIKSSLFHEGFMEIKYSAIKSVKSIANPVKIAYVKNSPIKSEDYSPDQIRTLLIERTTPRSEPSESERGEYGLVNINHTIRLKTAQEISKCFQMSKDYGLVCDDKKLANIYRTLSPRQVLLVKRVVESIDATNMSSITAMELHEQRMRDSLMVFDINGV